MIYTSIKYLCLLLAITVVFSACKVSRPSQKTTESQTDTLGIVKTDTTIQEPADSTIAQVPEVQDSVVIGIHRVLKDTLTIVGVGDIMMGTNYPENWYLPSNHGAQLFAEVDTILRNADVTFGNLEGVILNKGGDAKYCRDPKVCYIFRSPEYLAQNLVKTGFDVMSTANNHAGDFGTPGRKNTMKVLDSLGINHAGLLTNPYTTFERDGMRYGFAAFAPNTGTVSINDIANAKKIVAHLDSISDIVIISFHGGAEGSKYQHVTRKNEYFYGENRGNVYLFAHQVIDAGADIVFGHGPHVTRAVEVYKNKFIAYSLGNFCTYARFNLRGDNGLAPIIKVFTDSYGNFIKGEITPVIQIAPGGPSIDPQKRVISRLQQLTEKDFPEVKIKIDDSGIITYIQD
ncbi:CapA family protein [Fulvivirga sp. 29W222]|uniref:CapA family protein n=1 Tax=Fulvivirga marina TaxID=2494733 RepID=A0A937KGC1_9BACT|nr:CapA family protein [Fulvivirga marina]MBL6449043.1 CapA family protein [Fulvivirga marina]